MQESFGFPAQTSNMPASAATASNTSSRRATAPTQKKPGKAQNVSSPEANAGPDEPPSKRPKRTLKLTASQRERKRAIDREAQRSIRLKTKNYIAHLENLVSIMENGVSNTESGESAPSHDSSTSVQDGERARTLLSQLRHSEEEIRNLKEMLFGVKKLVGSALSPADEIKSKWLTLTPARNGDQTLRSANFLQGGAHDYLENCASVYSHSSDSSSPMVELGYQAIEHPETAEAYLADFPSNSKSCKPNTLQQQDLYNSFGRLSVPSGRPEPPTSDPADAPKSREEGDLFFLSDREVNRVLAGGHQSFSNQPLDEDIVVRAVLHGWRDVQDEYLLDKGWQALRSIDQSIFRECGVVERMAILYMMRLKLLHQSNTNPQFLAPLPPFFQRSSQEDVEALKKTPVIEHFIWPGLRASLCTNPQKYINNKFSDSFRQSFKFVWPFNISDTYTKDFSTQLYSITPGFKQRQWDLHSWTMRRDFFAHASELIGSIPVYEAPIARTLIPAGSEMRPVPIPAATHTHHPSQGSHRQMSVTKIEEREAGHLQVGSGHDNSHALSQNHGSGPQRDHEMTGAPVPYSAEVEAWLGDPDMNPQYWNMSPGMNSGYGATPAQWTGVHRGFVG